ncbi:acyl CoA binding protein-domain-containing protein [Cunninghamella echinulata]|nr:acyl CoA binding protein-domain-containing protein [Cunninghamella echinulata]
MEISQMELWFESAFDYLNTHKINVSKENKLKFYGYFKQATTGDCTLGKPSLFEFVARAKWDAWNNLKGMTSSDAMEAYVVLLESLNVGWTRQGEYEYKEESEEIENDMGDTIMSSLAHGEEEDHQDDLISYAKQNKLDKVKERVKEFKEPINVKDEQGLTALHHACDRGYLDLVKLLIDLGANINEQTDDLETPLHFACISEQLLVAQYLLDHGCDVSIVDSEGQTAFDQTESSFTEQLNYNK